MTKIRLTLACTESDRTRPVLDGRIAVPGVDLVTLPGEPEDIFRRALRDRAFDITELSMSSHIVTTARGDSAYIGIPVFPSRAFRHSGIYIRTGCGIGRPEDLKGRRVGLPEYQQTAALWVRGMLSEQYGVRPQDIEWVVGSQEVPGGVERTRISLPDDIRVERIGPDETLSGRLAAGAIDAIVTPRPPSAFLRHDHSVARLFPDYRTAEMAYFRDTRHFPIMHCIAVRRDVAEANPWLPVELFRAFSAAKSLAMQDLEKINFLRVALPWVASHLVETRTILGDNPWPYGVPANRHSLEAMLAYARADGLISGEIGVEALFHSSVLETIDAG